MPTKKKKKDAGVAPHKRRAAGDVRKRQAALDLYHAMLKHGTPAQKKRAQEGLAAMGEMSEAPHSGAGIGSSHLAPSGNEHIENMRRMPATPAWLAAMTPAERKRLAASLGGPAQQLTPAQERAILRDIGPDADFRRAARMQGDPVMRQAEEEHRRMLAQHGYRMLPNGKIVPLNTPVTAPARPTSAPAKKPTKRAAPHSSVSATRTRSHSAAPAKAAKDLSRYRVPVSQKNPEGLRWPADHPAAHRRAAQGRKRQNRG